jgi:hypothetical protein
MAAHHIDSFREEEGMANPTNAETMSYRESPTARDQDTDGMPLGKAWR